MHHAMYVMQVCTCSSIDKQASSGGPIQACVAHKRRLPRVEGGLRWGHDADLPSGHALTHVVIGLAHQLGLHS